MATRTSRTARGTPHGTPHGTPPGTPEGAAPSGAPATGGHPATTVVVYAKDKDRVAEFYRQALALQLAEWEEGFSVLAGRGIEISVVRLPEALARQVVIASPPVRREDTPLKASFLVPGFEAVRAAAAATGGALGPAEAEWTWRGCVHLDGLDPEGNVVQFRRADG